MMILWFDPLSELINLVFGLIKLMRSLYVSSKEDYLFRLVATPIEPSTRKTIKTYFSYYRSQSYKHRFIYLKTILILNSLTLLSFKILFSRYQLKSYTLIDMFRLSEHFKNLSFIGSPPSFPSLFKGLCPIIISTWKANLKIVGPC